MANETEKKIKRILSRSLGVTKKELVNGASFESDLNIGPIELREAINRVFEEFRVEVGSTGSLHEGPKFKTVGELVDFIKDHLDEIEE